MNIEYTFTDQIESIETVGAIDAFELSKSGGLSMNVVK